MKDTSDLKDRLRKNRLHILIITLVFIPLFALYYGINTDSGGVKGDSIVYVRIAYHIHKHNAVSKSDDLNSPYPLTSSRSPGYPFFLALTFKLIPELGSGPFDWAFKNPVDPPPSFVHVKHIQAFLLLLTALMAAYLVWKLTGKAYLAYAALIILAVHPFLYRHVNRTYVELFGVFLITCFSLSLYFTVKGKRVLVFLFTGFVLGALTLTLPQWNYIFYLCLLMFAALAWLEPQSRKRCLIGGLIFVLGFYSLVGPWKLRNYRQFDRSFVAQHGGEILLYRSWLNMMSAREYFSSFLYWSRFKPLKDMLTENFPREYYDGLDPDSDTGISGEVKKRKREVFEQYENTALADKVLMDESMERILSHPIRHLLVTVPIAYRGMVDGNLGVLNIIVYVFYFMGLIHCLRTRNYPALALLLPGLALIGFNSLLTHGNSRYNSALITIVWIGAMMGVGNMIDRRRARKKQE